VQAEAAQHAAQEVTPAHTAVSANDAVIGRLEIANIGLSVPVVANYDAASLVRGVGHVPGTAVPGGLGNFVLAGHRDTFFRPLRNIKAGMKIRIVTTGGAWSYAVDRTEIVTPAAVSVLDIGNVPELTLITCYPFDFIGAAPNRFIVHAHLLAVDAN
jgi:sortase A